MPKRLIAITTIIAANLVLYACGGSSGNNNQSPPPPTNNPPTANAGGDQAADENTIVQLAGQAADPDGDMVSVAWLQVSGPAAIINSTTSLDATVELPAVAIGTTESIVLEMTATDARGASASDQLTLTVDSNDYFLFTANEDNASFIELYKYDTRTDSVLKLSGTPSPLGSVSNAAISPGGQFVAYIANREVAGGSQLYVASIDGNSNVRISATMANPAGSVQSFEWAPAGSAIAYIADADVAGTTEAYLVDRNGANHRKISDDTQGLHQIERVSWSPNGRYVVQQLITPDMSSRFAADIHDTSLGAPNNIRVTPAATFSSVTFPIWSADSSRIAYLSRELPFDNFQLFTSLADGTDQVHVSGNAPNIGTTFGFGFSPVGDRIAYWIDDNSLISFDLYSADADGSNNTKINDPLSGIRSVSAFRWAPDGSRIAYAGDIDTEGVFELYTALPDGGENIKVSGFLGVDRSIEDFVWSPDSSRIAYTADQDTDELIEVYVSAADGSTNDKVSGTPTAGFDTLIREQPNRLWSPDSMKLVYYNNGHQISDVASLTVTQITFLPPPPQISGPGVDALWSSDGSRIVYGQNDAVPGGPVNDELRMVLPTGSDDRAIFGPLVAGGSIRDWVSWSP